MSTRSNKEVNKRESSTASNNKIFTLNRGYSERSVKRHLSELKFSDEKRSCTHVLGDENAHLTQFWLLSQNTTPLTRKWQLIENYPHLREIFNTPLILRSISRRKIHEIYLSQSKTDNHLRTAEVAYSHQHFSDMPACRRSRIENITCTTVPFPSNIEPFFVFLP